MCEERFPQVSSVALSRKTKSAFSTEYRYIKIINRAGSCTTRSISARSPKPFGRVRFLLTSGHRAAYGVLAREMDQQPQADQQDDAGAKGERQIESFRRALVDDDRGQVTPAHQPAVQVKPRHAEEVAHATEQADQYQQDDDLHP